MRLTEPAAIPADEGDDHSITFQVRENRLSRRARATAAARSPGARRIRDRRPAPPPQPSAWPSAPCAVVVVVVVERGAHEPWDRWVRDRSSSSRTWSSSRRYQTVRPSRRDRTTPAVRSSRRAWLTAGSAHVDGRRQVADAQLAGLGQGEEDPHPAPVAEQAEQARQPLGLVEVEEPAAGVGHPGGVDHPDDAGVERGDG